MERIVWDDESARHIRARSARYDNAINIDPMWTHEVVTDPDRLVDEPDPRSVRATTVRTTGYSSTANMIITVVAHRAADGTLHGRSAWLATGATRRQYREGTP